LCLKDQAGRIIFTDDPDDDHAYHPGDARADFERFLSLGFRYFTFSESSGGEGSGDGEFSEFSWTYNDEFSVVGNGFYHDDLGFEINFGVNLSLFGGWKKKLGSSIRANLCRGLHRSIWMNAALTSRT